MTRRRGLAVVLVAVAVGVGGGLGVRAAGVHPVKIVSGSMAPTVKPGQWIAVKDLDHDGRREVKRGDIVMFRFAGGATRALKRVVATSGDTVRVSAHSVTVNGRTIPISGAPGPASARSQTVHVAPAHVFLLGDNPRVSIDSRAFGAVPASEIVGRQLVTLGGRRSILLEALAATLLTAAAMIAAGLALRGRRS